MCTSLLSLLPLFPPLSLSLPSSPLSSHAGSRSEALASVLLELHGLQDMLDRLWEWVAGAEATMTDTESTPVGDELITVEDQLAAHEVC